MKTQNHVWLLLLFVFTCSFIIPDATATNTSKSSQQNVELEQAKKHFMNGEFQESIDLLERLMVTKTLPKESYVEASELLAVAYVSMNHDRKASNIFKRVLHRDPDFKPSDHWWPHKRLMNCYYKTFQEVEPSPKRSKKGPGIQTIAIMDFENNSIDDTAKYENLGGALSKVLISDFGVLSNLKVVERERIQYLIEELELTEKQVGGKKIVDESMAPRLGKLLGAHSFIFGSFIRIGDNFRIDARIVKTETGEIFKTASMEGDPDKVLELAKKLTLKISKDLELKIKKMDKEKLEDLGKERVPIEALALFGDAMSNANQEKYEAAYAKLEQALTVAPDFKKARDMLDVIRPYTL